MTEYYKAVGLDRTSHWDCKTKWRVGATICPDSVDESDAPCGHGIHCSPTLLAAVGWQTGPSRYYAVEPGRILGGDSTKARCDFVRVLRDLSRSEQDEIAGFRLWEANHPVNPLLRQRRIGDDTARALLRAWASVGPDVWDSVRESVRDSVGVSVWASVWPSVRVSVGASVWILPESGNSPQSTIPR